LTVAVMILVNNAGDGALSYAQLRHSAWNGCTLTDVVFPMFLFIVGGSIYLAFTSRLDRGVGRGEIMLQTAKRSALIFMVGLTINALPFFDLGQLRYYGVLQRIALCYAAASCVFIAGGLFACGAAAAIALIAYWMLMLHVPVPHLGLPGVAFPVLDRHANLASWLDRLLFSPAHLYHHADYDPEGLLSTIPAVATTLFGTLSASWLNTGLKDRPPATRRAVILFAAGIAFLLLGLLWSHTFPLNKRLWTSSFVLLTSGISMVAFATLFYLVDGACQIRCGLMPWLVFGTNALAAYVLSEVVAIVLGAIPLADGRSLQQRLFTCLPRWLGPPPLLSALYSVIFVGVCFLPIYWLYRRKIFIKL
jgi:predicted acyltransferase